MSILELELFREQLLKQLSDINSSRYKINQLVKYFKTVFGLNNENVEESFLPEFLSEFANYLSGYSANGTNPNKIESVLDIIKQLLKKPIDEKIKSRLSKEFLRIDKEYNALINVLNGETTSFLTEQIIFPVIEDNKTQNGRSGLLDTLSIIIQKNINKSKDDFFIVPSSREIDKYLKKQIDNSWNFALGYILKYIKPHLAHQVVIRFEKSYGNYSGDSLGIALTIGFIQKLLEFYEVNLEVSLKPNVASTGGNDLDGIVTNISKEIIKVKTETIFYSNVQTFVIPFEDYEAAMNERKRLKEIYPKRKLKIIGVESLDDILDSRRIVDIKKIKLSKRIKRKTLKNKSLVIVSLLFMLFISFIFLRDYDTNPFSLTLEKDYVVVENQFHKELFRTQILIPSYGSPKFGSYVLDFMHLVDIDSDGENEVIFCIEKLPKTTNNKNTGRVLCLNSDREIIWQHKLLEEIDTGERRMEGQYRLFTGNMFEYKGKKTIAVFGQHTYWSSPIYLLDVETGKRISEILWHPGRIDGVNVLDFDDDGKLELTAMGVNNYAGTSVFFSLELRNLRGAAPAGGQYYFKGKKITDFESYILLPKSDITVYEKYRMNSPTWRPQYLVKSNRFRFDISEGHYSRNGYDVSLMYFLDKNLLDITVEINNVIRVYRDELVAKKILEPPYTDTKEYREILKNQIRSWDGEKFVDSIVRADREKTN
ncbi:MAG: hypothetical protein JEY94_00665 [Melioribacteraceae bacterium]|nr:hypothetical protein [Melioribacteraceae bacterium]